MQSSGRTGGTAFAFGGRDDNYAHRVHEKGIRLSCRVFLHRADGSKLRITEARYSGQRDKMGRTASMNRESGFRVEPSASISRR
jgi:hypothetical protein